MNVKTYRFIKYISTLGLILVLLAPLLGLLHAWSLINTSKTVFRGDFLFQSQTALATTLWVLEIVGIVLIVVYLYLRDRLKRKSPYVYTKKDTYKLNLSYIFFGLTLLLSLVYVAISCGILGFPETVNVAVPKGDPFHKKMVGIMIAAAPMLIAALTFAILASVFEWMSRIQEQIFLYAKEDEEANKKGISVSESGVRRTAEAQELLSDEKPKEKKTSEPKKHKAEEYIDDEKTLEDFFHEHDDDEDNK